jgi:hypothetical protein
MKSITELKEIKLFDLQINKRYDIIGISKFEQSSDERGLIFILEGNMQLHLSWVEVEYIYIYA